MRRVGSGSGRGELASRGGEGKPSFCPGAFRRALEAEHRLNLPVAEHGCEPRSLVLLHRRLEGGLGGRAPAREHQVRLCRRVLRLAEAVGALQGRVAGLHLLHRELLLVLAEPLLLLVLARRLPVEGVAVHAEGLLRRQHPTKLVPADERRLDRGVEPVILVVVKEIADSLEVDRFHVIGPATPLPLGPQVAAASQEVQSPEDALPEVVAGEDAGAGAGGDALFALSRSVLVLHLGGRVAAPIGFGIAVGELHLHVAVLVLYPALVHADVAAELRSLRELDPLHVAVLRRRRLRRVLAPRLDYLLSELLHVRARRRLPLREAPGPGEALLQLPVRLVLVFLGRRRGVGGGRPEDLRGFVCLVQRGLVGARLLGGLLELVLARGLLPVRPGAPVAEVAARPAGRRLRLEGCQDLGRVLRPEALLLLLLLLLGLEERSHLLAGVVVLPRHALDGRCLLGARDLRLELGADLPLPPELLGVDAAVLAELNPLLVVLPLVVLVEDRALLPFLAVERGALLLGGLFRPQLLLLLGGERLDEDILVLHQAARLVEDPAVLEREDHRLTGVELVCAVLDLHARERLGVVRAVVLVALLCVLVLLLEAAGGPQGGLALLGLALLLLLPGLQHPRGDVVGLGVGLAERLCPFQRPLLPPPLLRICNPRGQELCLLRLFLRLDSILVGLLLVLFLAFSLTAVSQRFQPKRGSDLVSLFNTHRYFTPCFSRSRPFRRIFTALG
mmetsp:Transcript_20210/g.48154  ORF Transcript_20210/g.48154 Transcript_20210/m.48154 type:complete len:732 (+) Transcript_20210:80-2275(+)